MATRVSKHGSYRYERRWPPPVGRYAIATGAKTKAEYRQRAAVLDELYRGGMFDVLEAVRRRTITLEELLDAKRRKVPLETYVGGITLRRSLREAVDGWVPHSAKAERTRKRYKLSLDYLLDPANGFLQKRSPTVQALERVDWKAREKTWDKSPAHWNHIRRAVSAFLTSQLGNVHHPFRLGVMSGFPRQVERERIPDISPELFWAIVAKAPEHVQPALVALVATGMRTGEYLACEKRHLMPNTHQLRVPGTKTDGSTAVISVNEALWPWVERAIPSPLAYKALRLQWKAALRAAGADETLRLHDLRHCTGQWLINAGRPESTVQQTLRLATPAMTRRYVRQKDRAEDAKALADVMTGAATPDLKVVA